MFWIDQSDYISTDTILTFASLLVTSSRYTDTGAFQLYGHITEVVIAYNEGVRMTGFFAWGQWRGCVTCSAGVAFVLSALVLLCACIRFRMRRSSTCMFVAMTRNSA